MFDALLAGDREEPEHTDGTTELSLGPASQVLELLAGVLGDCDTNHILIKCRRPQVRLWAPDCSTGAFFTSGYSEIKRRRHGIVHRQGRIDLKSSWLMAFHDLQGFAVSDADMWYPDQHIGTGRTAAGFERVMDNCECDVSLVNFYHDSEAAVRERHTPVAVPKVDKASLSSQHLVNTICITFPTLRLKTTSAQWHAINSVFFELLFAQDVVEQENVDRLQTIKYNSWLSSSDAQSRITTLEELQSGIRHAGW